MIAPQGFADGMDDDAGTMSAWYIWSTLGLYPLTPGNPRYVVTAPLVRSATLQLPGKAPIVIRPTADKRMMIGGRIVSGRTVAHDVLTGRR